MSRGCAAPVARAIINFRKNSSCSGALSVSVSSQARSTLRPAAGNPSTPFPRPAGLPHRALADQAGFLQSVERSVDLCWAHIPVGLAADDGLEGRPQLIAVAGLLRQESQQGVADRHRVI